MVQSDFVLSTSGVTREINDSSTLFLITARPVAGYSRPARLIPANQIHHNRMTTFLAMIDRDALSVRPYTPHHLLRPFTT